ncbi:MAG: VWA domain-containing protein [Rikenellaceae bacterium]|nr:VWA domain-containing protein [Rikenellaceae bacterium]
MFRFASPEYFYLLALIPLFIVGYALAVRARRRRLARFGNPETLRQLMPDVSPLRVRNKFILLVVAVGLVVVALARPQFGSKLREVRRTGIELMLAVDVSNSMLAEDFEPNRLERTKFAITRLIDQLKQDQVGLIVFAGDAYVQLPITSDYATARNFVNNVSTDMVSRQGTAMGAAIELASNSFSSGSEGSRVLILISDGENHDDDPVAAAKAAAERGIKIYTIGIGTPEGAPIRLDNDFIKDEQGNIVVSKLDEATLEQVALATGGGYIRSTKQSIGLDEIIARVNENEKKDMVSKVFDDFSEQYQYPLGLAILLLLLNSGMLDRKNRILARFNVFGRNRKAGPGEA